jgi:hypothetical protein
MQPGTNPEDIHTILSRFSHWARKQTGNGHAKGLSSLDAGVREIPYEEAIRRMRSRKEASVANVVTPPPAIDVAQPPAEQETTPVEPQAVKDRVTAKARRAPRSNKPAPKQRAVAVQPQERPSAPGKQRCASKSRSHSASQPEFRQVLEKSVGETKRAHKPVRGKEKGRDQRVSVRLSREEERHLQACASKAGVTVAEYLRMRALEDGTTPSASRASVTRAAAPAAISAKADPEPAKRTRSGLGDWIALLRNRFLASPVRFAERA